MYLVSRLHEEQMTLTSGDYLGSLLGSAKLILKVPKWTTSLHMDIIASFSVPWIWNGLFPDASFLAWLLNPIADQQLFLRGGKYCTATFVVTVFTITIHPDRSASELNVIQSKLLHRGAGTIFETMSAELLFNHGAVFLQLTLLSILGHYTVITLRW